MSPIRIQRCRTPGWRMPEGAVYRHCRTCRTNNRPPKHATRRRENLEWMAQTGETRQGAADKTRWRAAP